MNSSMGLLSRTPHSVGEFDALRQKGEHGEFRVKKDGTLYIANDSFLSRKTKALNILPGAKAERQAALAVFKEALVEHCGSEQKAAVLFAKATAKHGDRLNVKDLDRIWSELHVPDPEPEPSSSSSSSSPKGYSPLHGREQVKAQLETPEGVRASGRMATALAGVAKDERLLELIKDNKLSIKERVVQHGVASGKFYAGLVPFVGAGIKAADANASSKELRALKSLRDDFAAHGEPNPLLSACIDGLEDHNRVKRNKNAISAGLDLGMKAVSYATGGISAPVTEAASEIASDLLAKVIGSGVSATASKVTDVAATKGGQAHAEHHVDHLQARSAQVIGSGDQATRLSDYHAVRALLIYLGPADQSGEIRADTTISSEKRAQLLEQEQHRLALKEMLGSAPDEDLTKGLQRTKGDQRFIDELATRKTSGKGEDMYLQLRDTDGDDAPSPLRALWMLEGWIGTDNQLEKAVNASKEKATEAATALRDRVQPMRYERL